MKRLWIFAAGIATGIAVTILTLLIFLRASLPTAEEMASKEIQLREKKLGYSCDEVRSRATSFITGPLSEMVRLGKTGGDWAYEGFTKHRSEIHWLRESVLQCDLLSDSKVRSKLLPRNDFRPMTDLFTELDAYTAPSGEKPPHSSNWKPEALERIVAFHRDLTANSRGTPIGAPQLER